MLETVRQDCLADLSKDPNMTPETFDHLVVSVRNIVEWAEGLGA